MVKTKVNWLRIVANAGFAFFTVLASLNIVGDGSIGKQLLTAIVGATISAGLAAFSELKSETDTDDAKELKKAIKLGMVF